MQIHLIRHGEVANPSHIAYADIPGYRLSAKGREQATAAGRYLAARPVRRIIASPLDRATETAGLISTITGCVVVTDPRLTEWGLGVRWRGTTWPALPIVFPGELEAYLAHPQDLPFAPESLTEVADRMSAAIADGNDPGDCVSSRSDPRHTASTDR